MTSPLMNHKDAVSSLAVERYLLGELKDEERAAFEEHYLNCTECMDAVTFGDEFMEAAEPVARELALAEKRGHAPLRERRSGSFLENLLAVMRTPAPAWALVAVLGVVVSFQGLRRHQQNLETVGLRTEAKELQALKVPSQEIRYQLKEEQRSAGPVVTISARRNTPLRLEVGFTPGDFVAYRADILAAGVRKYSVPLSVRPNDEAITINLFAGALPGSGRYLIVVQGIDKAGMANELGNGIFDLKLVD